MASKSSMRVLRWVLISLLLLSPGAAQSPAFEVVSIKPNDTENARDMRMQVLPGGRFSATSLPLRALLVYAYNLPINPSERLSGVPDWVNSARYDVEAKAPDGSFPTGLPTSEAIAKMRTMVQVLLAERFKLVMRRETKDMSIYALTVASGGPKLQPSNIREEDCPLDPMDGASCHQFMGGQGRGLHAKAVNMKDLAGHIENWTDHPVVDRTGLNGLFAMDTDGWTPMGSSPLPPAGAAVPNPTTRPSGDGDMSDPARPTLFTVLRRLGLDLKPQKGRAEIYVVKHVERPAGN
jgi:uncharacterized protein (TIGR03435 family)